MTWFLLISAFLIALACHLIAVRNNGQTRDEVGLLTRRGVYTSLPIGSTAREMLPRRIARREVSQ